MEPKIPRSFNNRPEDKIKENVMALLRKHGWFVIKTHGNAFQSGLPDLYACNRKYGSRWIELKVAGKYSLTAAQMSVFPQLTAQGVGIWIIVNDSWSEYQKLFAPPNWHLYLNCLK
jgi:hypothetical protein